MSVGMIILVSYLLGYAVTWRHMVGFLYHDLDSILAGLYLGSILNLFWPVIIPIWLAYRFAIRHELDKLDLSGVFPKPKRIESKADEQRRLDRMREREMLEYQRYINQKEREAGIIPTTWELR